jgi:CRP-like cAMP-binding protein
MIPVKTIAQMLQQVPIFQVLSFQELQEFAPLFTEKKHKKGTILFMVDMKLTHQQLANMVETVRESVTKVLLELQTEQIIEIRQKRIILKNMDALKSELNPSR